VSLSLDTIASVVIGGVITLVVAAGFFWVQERRARCSFELLARFLENFAASEGASVGFTRDAKGRIKNASVVLRAGTGELKIEGYAPTLTVTRNNTESEGQNHS
jgi:hypothetical protein